MAIHSIGLAAGSLVQTAIPAADAVGMELLVHQALVNAGLAAAHPAPHPAARHKPKHVAKPAKKKKHHHKAPAKTHKPTMPGASGVPATATLGPIVTPAATGTPVAVVPPVLPPTPLPTPTGPAITPAWPAVFPPASAGQGSAPGGVALDSDPVAHLARRVTFGPTATLATEIRGTGVAAWLEQQLNPGSIDDSACDAAVAAMFPLLAMDSLTARANMPAFSWNAMAQTQWATLARAVSSRRQVFEAVVDVWNQNFNITCPSDKVWSVRHVHEKVLRANALGRFTDLLIAVETGPAMLQYLDNAESNGNSANGVNENLGRELMELHTLSLAAGYTETDVRNSAYALSGLSVMDDGSDLFEYKPGYRYVGPLQVLGWSSPNADPYGGLAVAKDYLTYLAHHPATATNICTVLARRFVSDTPPASLVSKMVAAYQLYDTAIVPVLRVLFASTEFWSSWGQKVRRPFEHVASTLRTLGTTAAVSPQSDAWQSWCWFLGTMGMAPLMWAPPSGYPDVAAAWLNTNATMGRWNTTIAAVDQWWKTGGIAMPALDWSTLLRGQRPATFGAFIDAVGQAVIHQVPGTNDRTALLTYLNHKATDVPSDNDLKYHTADVACLLLSSPTWSLR